MTQELRKLAVRYTKAYPRYRNVVQNLDAGGVTPEFMLREASNLHRTRVCRTLYDKRLSASLLSKAILEDLSNRARLSEFLSQLLLRQELLETALRVAKAEVQSVLAEHLHAMAKTQGERAKLLEFLFANGEEQLAVTQGAVERINVFIKDIDQASFALQRTVALFQVQMDRKEAVE